MKNHRAKHSVWMELMFVFEKQASATLNTRKSGCLIHTVRKDLITRQ